jgi:uncharacterized protein YceK
MKRIGLCFAVAAIALLPATSRADAWTRTVLSRLGGATPDGNLISDKAGNLYGTAGASVFRLTPPKAGRTALTESVLYNFDIGSPYSLLMDAAGNLYGVTDATGVYQGTVFKLTPPATGQTAWTMTVLHSFGSLHEGPSSTLTMDAAGDLYGDDNSNFYGYGKVYKLTPPAAGQTKWTETALASVVYGPSVVFDKAGNLYGADRDTGGDKPITCPGPGCGSVFKLTPPASGKGAWKKTVIYRFTGGADGALPQGSLAIGEAGVIYGTTQTGGKGPCSSPPLSGCGTVFKLTPPAPGKSTWTETVLYRFDPINPNGPRPLGGLSVDRAGNLYGATQSYEPAQGRGTVYRLTRPSAGNSTWSFSIVSQFYGTSPQSGLLIDAQGAVFGVASRAEAKGGFVYQLTP